MNVRESVVEIGQPAPLIGIISETDRRSDTAVLLLNSGIIHRVGACRLSVRLARQITTVTAVPCLRFDFSGLGDSSTRRITGLNADQVAVAEVLEAMDYLEGMRGIRRFILYGLCSGARTACAAAEMDRRVIGVVQLDGYCYPTLKAYLHYYSARLAKLETWRRRLAALLGFHRPEPAQGSILAGARADFEVPEFAEDPGRDAVAAQLQTLVDRDVQLHCVFTGREPYYRYRHQFLDCFSDVDFGGSLSIDYYPEASHIFTEPLYQQQMIEGVVNWVGHLAAGATELPECEQAFPEPAMQEALV